jgi:hypothetical protein
MELAAIFTATPAEIDVEIARIDTEISWLDWRRELTVKTFLSEHSTVEEAAAAKKLNTELAGKVNSLRALNTVLRGEYMRRGTWKRVYAVNNTNGHFHRTRSCRNTYSTTEWVWMPELSGLTNAEVVERTGKMTCLTCFADQRDEIEKGREATVFTPAQAKTREEQAAAAAQRAAKQAKAAASAITDIDGSPLRGDNGVIKTERTAWIEAVDALTWAEYSEYMITTAPQHLEGEQLDRQIAWSRKQIKEHAETCGHIAQALANKTGRDLADVLTEINTKADKKIKAARKSRAAEEARLNG